MEGCRQAAKPDRGGSVSAFARKVGLSEALIRKYLKGAEPGLGKVGEPDCHEPTARAGGGSPPVAGISIVRPRWWTGDALAAAGRWCRDPSGKTHAGREQLVTLLAYYQFLRSHKQADGFLDLARAGVWAPSQWPRPEPDGCPRQSAILLIP